MNWMIEDYELEARCEEFEWRNSPEAQAEYAAWREEIYRDVPPPTPEKE